MNRKVMAGMAAVLAAGILGGCGSDTEVPLKDMDVDSYVTLGEYKGIEVDIDPITVDETELENLVREVYNNNVTLENGGITDRAVENGDTVNIDYVGSIDGVEYVGGRTQGQGTDLTIGSGSYIDDFEEQLIGAHPGDTVNVYATFPVDYGKEDLNGKEALFVVTENGIYQ